MRYSYHDHSPSLIETFSLIGLNVSENNLCNLIASCRVKGVLIFIEFFVYVMDQDLEFYSSVAAMNSSIQGRNEVCGMKDQKGGIREQKDGIWDHSPGTRDHIPRDRDQQFFQGPGIRLYRICGI